MAAQRPCGSRKAAFAATRLRSSTGSPCRSLAAIQGPGDLLRRIAHPGMSAHLWIRCTGREEAFTATLVSDRHLVRAAFDCRNPGTSRGEPIRCSLTHSCSALLVRNAALDSKPRWTGNSGRLTRRVPQSRTGGTAAAVYRGLCLVQAKSSISLNQSDSRIEVKDVEAHVSTQRRNSRTYIVRAQNCGRLASP